MEEATETKITRKINLRNNIISIVPLIQDIRDVNFGDMPIKSVARPKNIHLQLPDVNRNENLVINYDFNQNVKKDKPIINKELYIPLNEKTVNNKESKSSEKEFEKIYEEILRTPSLNEEIKELVTLEDIIDPSLIEVEFEEIVNEAGDETNKNTSGFIYALNTEVNVKKIDPLVFDNEAKKTTNKISEDTGKEPINLDNCLAKRKSKIPLLRYYSETGIEILKNAQKQRSVNELVVAETEKGDEKLNYALFDDRQAYKKVQRALSKERLVELSKQHEINNENSNEGYTREKLNEYNESDGSNAFASKRNRPVLAKFLSEPHNTFKDSNNENKNNNDSKSKSGIPILIKTGVTNDKSESNVLVKAVPQFGTKPHVVNAPNVKTTIKNIAKRPEKLINDNNSTENTPLNILENRSSYKNGNQINESNKDTAIPKELIGTKSILKKIALFEGIKRGETTKLEKRNKEEQHINNRDHHKPVIVEAINKIHQEYGNNNQTYCHNDLIKHNNDIFNNVKNNDINTTNSSADRQKTSSYNVKVEINSNKPNSKCLKDLQKANITKESQIKKEQQKVFLNYDLQTEKDTETIQTENEKLHTDQKNKPTEKLLEKKSLSQRDTAKDIKKTPLSVFSIFKQDYQKDIPVLKRTKSLADIEIGDKVHGKVELVIKELFIDKGTEKPAAIKARERPRRNSVSEKIALFEKKITPITMNIQPFSSDKKHEATDDPITEELKRKQKLVASLTNLKYTLGNYEKQDIMPFYRLHDGNRLPVITLGTALLLPDLTKYVVGAAIELGYRAIDTAYIYGNEKQVGEGIQMKIDDGTIKREDIFVVSKLWNTFHKPELVEGACTESLKNLGLSYVDMYLIHTPMSFKEGDQPIPMKDNMVQYSDFTFVDAWKAMITLKQKGLARSIGVSNFNPEQLSRLINETGVKPAVNQVECHPYLTQTELDQFCKKNHIAIMAYSVLGSKGTPAAYKASNSSAVIEDPAVRMLAKKTGFSPAQILMRYQLERGHCMVVKSSTPDHLLTNLNCLNMKLTEDQMEVLNGLNKDQRNFDFKGMGDTHDNYPFHVIE